MTRYSIKSSLGDWLGTSSSVTGVGSDRFRRRLLPKPKRSSTSHTRSDNGRCSRSNNNSLGSFMSRDVSEGFRQSLFGKRAAWDGWFLLHRHTSTEGSSFCGARDNGRFGVRGRDRPGFERRPRSFGSANGGWVCSGRLRVPCLRGSSEDGRVC